MRVQKMERRKTRRDLDEKKPEGLKKKKQKEEKKRENFRGNFVGAM